MPHDPKLVEGVARGLAFLEWDHSDFWDGFVEEATAALDAIEAMGMVVVPVEPDPEMCIKGGIAAAEENPKAVTWVDTANACYRAMVAARPGAQP